jgi:hypothetical protein
MQLDKKSYVARPLSDYTARLRNRTTMIANRSPAPCCSLSPEEKAATSPMDSNAQATTINHGLGYDSATAGESSTHNISPASPAFQIELKGLVSKLMKPPEYAFPYGMLSIYWVVQAAGYDAHFECSDGRPVLKRDSQLRLSGRKLGLPAAYLEWICGDGNTEEGSVADLNLLLTPEFFQSEV